MHASLVVFGFALTPPPPRPLCLSVSTCCTDPSETCMFSVRVCESERWVH